MQKQVKSVTAKLPPIIYSTGESATHKQGLEKALRGHVNASAREAIAIAERDELMDENQAIIAMNEGFADTIGELEAKVKVLTEAYAQQNARNNNLMLMCFFLAIGCVALLLAIYGGHR